MKSPSPRSRVRVGTFARRRRTLGLEALGERITPAAAALDPYFATGGTVRTAIGSGDDMRYASVIDSAGRLLVAGYSFNGSNGDFAVIRYNADGALDTSFGGTGQVVTDVAGSDDSGNAITIDSQGRIIVAGAARVGSNDDFAVMRYNRNGTLDNTFSGDGKATAAILGGNDIGMAVSRGRPKPGQLPHGEHNPRYGERQVYRRHRSRLVLRRQSRHV